jgi:hypothetical protein
MPNSPQVIGKALADAMKVNAPLRTRSDEEWLKLIRNRTSLLGIPLDPLRMEMSKKVQVEFVVHWIWWNVLDVIAGKIRWKLRSDNIETTISPYSLPDGWDDNYEPEDVLFYHLNFIELDELLDGLGIVLSRLGTEYSAICYGDWSDEGLPVKVYDVKVPCKMPMFLNSISLDTYDVPVVGVDEDIQKVGTIRI